MAATSAFDLETALAERRRLHRYRTRLNTDAPAGRETVVDGRRYLNFCANDYLGLANHPDVVQALKQAADDIGVGSGASHLVCGHSRFHHALEEQLADATGRPRALLFSTGFMANLGVVGALLDKPDAVFEDKLNHASLIDAGLASGARFRRYLHNDADSLAAQLARADARRKLVITDGVFSMDGDAAPLAALCDVADAHDAWMMVDDAHGFGVLGEQGVGTPAAQQVAARIPVYMATLGKALGTFGAFVAGSEALIETLIQFARPYIYTTAMPPAVAAATLKSLAIMRTETWRREKLVALIAQFRRGAQAQGYTLMDSATPIQPLLIGDDAAALQLSGRLREQGVLVSAIRPPTVPDGTARLRVTLSAAHAPEDVDALLAALGEAPSSQD
ncbi:8-amino-7-oxononanoate synthase [Isoalcanivorax pacificus W11-5]|uniref:8-amino-7-oxononanoate synthase n=1 Tax=Isoalcanivorax pacificus W11-5 TaxID=391936 RepID=A0A0B4XJN5_9GAMM|nr:8-amino-7-oxononanoate synthase [Isoalcanivorax pacificus]AJD46783.1 8-amino-7-oxononanoate synthase [Isoalcanivorax pacificus W11-5]